MTSVAEGTCDIGMASRELKDSELANGLQPTVIAMDGIAVIVNQENTVSDMTSDTVKAIFTGATTDWSEVAKSTKEKVKREGMCYAERESFRHNF